MIIDWIDSAAQFAKYDVRSTIGAATACSVQGLVMQRLPVDEVDKQDSNRAKTQKSKKK